nr:gustatory receptor [Semanotus bifasciatus]
MLGWYFYFKEKKNATLAKRFNYSFMVLICVWNLLEVGIVVTSLVNSNLFMLEHWKLLHGKLLQGEILLGKLNCQISTKTNRRFYCEVIIVFTLFLCLQMCRMHFWFHKHNYEGLVDIVGGAAAHFYMNLLLITTLNLSQALQRRYSFLNETIVHLIEGDFIDDEIISKLQIVISLYKTLHTVVEMFNKIFGWHMFFFVSVSVVNVLVAVIFGMEVNFILMENGPNCAVTITCMASLVVVIMCCNSVEVSGEKVAKTCLSLQNLAKSKRAEEQLLQFAQYAEEWKPIFSAAGFYHVNQLTLTSIFKTIITYLVILIQFDMALKH